MTTLAGIGARITPVDVLQMMEHDALQLAIRGARMRSGGADGADGAFERGYKVFYPHLFTVFPGNVGHYIAWQEHAARYHPNWNACSETARALHARNSAIMCGPTLDEPVSAVLCWTEGGAIKGGTGQSLRIAAALGIPVFNYAVERGGVLDWLGERGL